MHMDKRHIEHMEGRRLPDSSSSTLSAHLFLLSFHSLEASHLHYDKNLHPKGRQALTKAAASGRWTFASIGLWKKAKKQIKSRQAVQEQHGKRVSQSSHCHLSHTTHISPDSRRHSPSILSRCETSCWITASKHRLLICRNSTGQAAKVKGERRVTQRSEKVQQPVLQSKMGGHMDVMSFQLSPPEKWCLSE